MKLNSFCRVGALTTAILLPLNLTAQTKPSNKTEAANPALVAAGPNHHLLQARSLFNQGKMEESSIDSSQRSAKK